MGISVCLLLSTNLMQIVIATQRPRRTRKHSSNAPHIIYILADDLGYSGVGYKNEKLITPTIDALAGLDGIKLESYYAYTTCAPSRFSLLTGRDAFKSESLSNNFQPYIPMGTNLTYKMLPQALKDAGYDTHMMGKWHQGLHRREYLPTHRGFDSFIGILTGSADHFTQENDNGEVSSKCKFNNHVMIDWTVNETAEEYQQEMFSDDAYVRHAVEVIRDHDQTIPLFIYLALQVPHSPFQVPSDFAMMYTNEKRTTAMDVKDAVYFGMLSHLDKSVKHVVHALNKSKMWDRTLLIFSSDNGAPLEAPTGSNGPLRGSKGQMWEGGLRVPAFLSGGVVPSAMRGRKLKGLVSIADWYATIAHLSGATVDNAGPFKSDSINQWPYFTGESSSSPRSEIIHHFAPVTERATIRLGKWKMLVAPETDSNVCEIGRPCLYDIEADPYEEHNLAWHKETNDVMKLMKQRWGELVQEWNAAGSVVMALWNDEDMKHDFSTQACNTWTKSRGLITPWATEGDEEQLATRVGLQIIAREPDVVAIEILG